MQDYGNDWDTIAKKLSEAAQNLDNLTAKLIGLTGQPLEQFTTPAAAGPGFASSTPKPQGLFGLWETLFPRQTPLWEAKKGVWNAGKDLWGGLTGLITGRATSADQTITPSPERGGRATSSAEFPIPLPVRIVEGATAEAGGKAADASGVLDDLAGMIKWDGDKLVTGNAGRVAGAEAGAAAMAGGEAGAAAGAAGGAEAGAAGGPLGMLIGAALGLAVDKIIDKVSKGEAVGPAGEAVANNPAANAAKPLIDLFTTLVARIKDYRNAVEETTRSQLELNRTFAELSPKMAQIFAEADARDVFRTNEVGNRAAASARFLSESDQQRKDNTKELDLLVTRLENLMVGIENKLTSIVLWLPNRAAALVNKLLDEDGSTDSGFAEAFEKQAREEEKRQEEARKRLENS